MTQYKFNRGFKLNRVDIYHRVLKTSRPSIGFAIVFSLVNNSRITKHDVVNFMEIKQDVRDSFLSNIGKVAKELMNLSVINIHYIDRDGNETDRYVKGVTILYELTEKAQIAWHK